MGEYGAGCPGLKVCDRLGTSIDVCRGDANSFEARLGIRSVSKFHTTRMRARACLSSIVLLLDEIRANEPDANLDIR
jgi:hypothetical protein